jgi:hypothetical protein
MMQVLGEALVRHVRPSSLRAVQQCRFALNFRPAGADYADVDQVSRPMQIALVAVVLLAGMWFTVLKPKPDTGSDAAPVASQPVAPGVKGLANAVGKAKGAAAASDAANAKVQAATGGSPATAAAAKPAVKAKAKTIAAPAAKPAAAKHTAAKSTVKAKAAKPAAAKPGAKAATPADPSSRLLPFLDKGKTLVVLFYGAGAIDRAARKAVHLTAKADPKHVVSAYVPIADVGKYEAITSDVQVLTSPTVLVIGADRKATPLTGFFDAAVIRQTVGDARREAASAKK